LGFSLLLIEQSLYVQRVSAVFVQNKQKKAADISG
jgi:hypothetical protein